MYIYFVSFIGCDPYKGNIVGNAALRSPNIITSLEDINYLTQKLMNVYPHFSWITIINFILLREE